MRINIAATKGNLIKTKKTLSMTEEGHSLLDEKRRILINELTSIVYVVDKIQKDVDIALSEAYSSVDKAIVTMGKRKMEEISLSVNIKTELTISQRRIMGVAMPVIDMEIYEKPPYYSPHEVNFYADEAIEKFKAVLKLLAQLAEKKISLLRLAKEAQKTIRKVNALEKIHLPFYRDTLKTISDRLDEESRESFSMLKLLKQRMGK